ncbi:MAG: tRNA (N6-threonylcarbamoyladenosine(37)-N6)-methyltransferase TrmO [Kofleriaceae bacterium]|nr:tRNA (N6-threonylcarbamoyladenosine(37)-N6)-methyltransferase TrmO [Kofleriaceae bacterium]
MAAPTFTMTAIGVVHSGFADKVSTPRQPFVAAAAPGQIELYTGHNFEHALEDLGSFSHIWVVFVFDQNPNWRPKVLPPFGSDKRRGVFATRSPHRPNPIGMSVLQLHGIVGRTLHVSGLDILDGTPVLDIKPYVPMADIVSHANRGWLEAAMPAHEADPTHDQHGDQHDAMAAAALGAAAAAKRSPVFAVHYAARAAEQLAWWRQTSGEDLQPGIERVLAVAPAPQAFRRIRKGPNGGMVLGMPGWRIDFVVKDQTVEVLSLRSAYKRAQFDSNPALFRNRDFVEKFGG